MSVQATAARLDPSVAAQFGAAALRVAPAIARAAGRVGEDFAALLHTARLESGFNTAARAPTSSATGLFQFIDSTWLALLSRHGPRHGIAPETRAQALALRRDPQVASLMAAEFMAENRRALEGALGRPVSVTDLYLAHFLGAGGAVRFLAAMAAEPGRAAADLFPRAAAANRSLFFAGGVPRSLAELHALFARRLGAEGGTSGAGIPHGAGTGVPGGPRGNAAPNDAPDDAPGRPAPPAATTDRGLSPALAARLAMAVVSAAAIDPPQHDGRAPDTLAGLLPLPPAAILRPDGRDGRPVPGGQVLPPRGSAAPGRASVAAPAAAEAAQAAYLLLAGLGR